MTPELNPLQPRSIDLPTSVLLSHTEDLTILDGAKILAGPDKLAYRPAWRWALERWRDGARRRIGYSDELYQDPALNWTRRCYSVCLVWLWDELLCDHETGRFTPQAFVEAARRDLGGFDAIVLWQAYPVIGKAASSGAGAPLVPFLLHAIAGSVRLRRLRRASAGSRRAGRSTTCPRPESDQESRSEPRVRSITWSVTAAPTAITINEGGHNDRRRQDPHLPRHGPG